MLFGVCRSQANPELRTTLQGDFLENTRDSYDFSPAARNGAGLFYGPNPTILNLIEHPK